MCERRKKMDKQNHHPPPAENKREKFKYLKTPNIWRQNTEQTTESQV